MSLKQFGWPQGTEEKKLPSGKKEIVLPKPTNFKEFNRSRQKSAERKDDNWEGGEDPQHNFPKIESMGSRAFDDASGESHSPLTRQDRLKSGRTEERRLKALD